MVYHNTYSYQGVLILISVVFQFSLLQTHRLTHRHTDTQTDANEYNACFTHSMADAHVMKYTNKIHRLHATVTSFVLISANMKSDYRI